ncbi:MAG: glycosyltransferase [Clostridia bacterium]|nr:glycosyltransferase [Clostridia bacterium]
MKIAVVMDMVDSRCGAVVSAKRFCEGLEALGHEVRIVAHGATGENDCTLDKRRVPLLSWVAKRNETIFAKYDEEKIRPVFEWADVIHFVLQFKMEKKAKKLADEMGKPTTAAIHVQPENITYGGHIERIPYLTHLIYRYYYNRFYRYFDTMHCPSEFIKSELIKHGFKNPNLVVISNGFEPQFRPPEKKEPHDGFIVTMTGRLSADKRQRILISAIAKSRHSDMIRLKLFGRGTKKEKYLRQAKRLGVNLEITDEFLPIEELAYRVGQSDLYVHTGCVEIEAIACLEATACGLVPIISNSKSSATKQFALTEKSLFRANDSKDLAKKIDYWYEHPDERAEYGEKYAEAAKGYTIAESIKKAEEMFLRETERVNRVAK